jgi:hypothetical protein
VKILFVSNDLLLRKIKQPFKKVLANSTGFSVIRTVLMAELFEQENKNRIFHILLHSDINNPAKILNQIRFY